MKTDSAAARNPLHSGVLRRALAYLGAVVLPSASVLVSFRTHALHSTPMALSMAAIAVVTILSGAGPGVVATLAATAFFNHHVAEPGHLLALGARELTQTLATLLVGLLVTFFFHRQHVIDRRLRVALAALQRQSDALAEAQQAGSSVAWTFSTVTTRIEWEPGGARVFGRPFDQSMNMLPLDLVLDDDRAAVQEIFDHAFSTGTPFQMQFRSRWPNGELHWLESRGTPSPTSRGIWRGITIDVTERKQAELALLRSEKLAAIGRLSATIAHEMNNPLEAVTNLLYLTAADTTLTPQTRSYLSSADQELRRLASIARHTLSFARSRSPAGPAQTMPIIESVVAMFQPRCSTRGGEIRIVSNPEIRVAAAGDELRQVLTNLVSNACDALDGAPGIIEVESLRQEGLVIIEVRDTGVGIPAENVARIFDPFFTTKPDVGTGIGLWVTRELVDKCGGEITVRTKGLPAGFRTAFRLELPFAD